MYNEYCYECEFFEPKNCDVAYNNRDQDGWCCHCCMSVYGDMRACAWFLPKGGNKLTCCGQCVYMNTSDEHPSRSNEYWCSYRNCYYPVDDSVCSNFREREGGSGCYLTTVVVECLGFDDKCEQLQTLRKFRDQTMKNDLAYSNILAEYDIVGPIIAKHISHDPQKMVLAKDLLKNYVEPVCEFVRSGNHEAAVELYKTMVVKLKERYKL